MFNGQQGREILEERELLRTLPSASDVNPIKENLSLKSWISPQLHNSANFNSN